jgi:hypothetical protein
VALARMAALRQATGIDDEVLDLFSAELDAEGIAADVIVEACNTLAKRSRAEGETAFPSFGTLLEECRDVLRGRERARQRALAAQGEKLLSAYENAPQLSRGDAKQFMAWFKGQVDARVAEQRAEKSGLRLVDKKAEDAA